MADYFIYMLECRGNRLYTGYSRDPRRRYRQHCAGKARCKFTMAFAPVRPVACWRIEGSCADAMRIECWIKNRPRSVKVELLRSPALLNQAFPEFNLQPEPFGDW